MRITSSCTSRKAESSVQALSPCLCPQRFCCHCGKMWIKAHKQVSTATSMRVSCTELSHEGLGVNVHLLKPSKGPIKASLTQPNP